MMSFASLLQGFRIRAKLSKKRLAELAKVDRNRLADWEAGRRVPRDYSVVQDLAEQLNLTEEEAALFRDAYTSVRPLRDSPDTIRRAKQMIDEGIPSDGVLRTETLTTPISSRPFLREVFDPLIEDRTSLFGGRDEVFTNIIHFVQHIASGYLIITGSLGVGKTALVAALITQTPNIFAYHFFTSLYGHTSLSEKFFLRNVVEQLASWHGNESLLPDGIDELRALYHKFIGQPLTNTRVLVLDGIDEITTWSLVPYISRSLPVGLHIIITMRDVGQNWISEYQLPNDQLWHLPLTGLTQEEVAQVLHAAGPQAAILADDPTLFNEVLRVAAYPDNASFGADPFYVRLLAEDAVNGHLTADTIDNQPSGLDNYLDKWWQSIKQHAGDMPTRDLLGTLCVALGPMYRADLEAINSSLVDMWANDYFDDVLLRVRRFVIGNNRSGYSIAHPRLREFMRGRINTSVYRQKVVNYCSQWRHHRSQYAFAYYHEHLLNEKQWEDLFIVARNSEFLQEQLSIFPFDLNVPLRVVQTALIAANETDNICVICEFLLRYPQWVLDIRKESPLDALEAGSLERAWQLADLFEIERCILWYLLLVWELKDRGKRSELYISLQRLLEKKLVRFSGWQARCAVDLLVHVVDTNLDAFRVLYKSLLGDGDRRSLCQCLATFDYLEIALEVAQDMKDIGEQVEALIEIALSQLIAGQSGLDVVDLALNSARTIEDEDLKADKLKSIAIMQTKAGSLDAAFETANEIEHMGYKQKYVDALAEIAVILAKTENRGRASLIFESALKDAQSLADKRTQIVALLNIAQAQLKLGDQESARRTLAISLEIKQQAEQKNGSLTRDVGPWSWWILSKIVAVQAKMGAFDVAFKTAGEILDGYFQAAEAANATSPKTSQTTARFEWSLGQALEEIARAQVQAGMFDEAFKTVQEIIRLRQNLPEFIALVTPETGYKYFFLDLGHSLFETLKQIGIALAQMGDLARAREIADEIDDQGMISQVLRAIALAQEKLGNSKAALDTILEIQDEGYRAQIFLDIARIQIKAGEEKVAKSTLTACLKSISLDNRQMIEEALRRATKESEAEGSQEAPGWVELITLPPFEEPKASALQDIVRAQAKVGAFDLALQTAKSIENEWLLKLTLEDIARAEAKAGAFDAALEVAQEIEELGDRLLLLLDIATLQIEVGGWDAALITINSVLQIARDMQDTKVLYKIATVLAEAGAFDAALEVAQEIEELGDRLLLLLDIAMLQIEAGDWEKKNNTLGLAWDVLGQLEEEEQILLEGFLERLALVLALQGQFDAALDVARQISLRLKYGVFIDEVLPQVAYTFKRIAVVQARLGALDIAQNTALEIDQNGYKQEYIEALVEIASIEAEAVEREKVMQILDIALQTAEMIANKRQHILALLTIAKLQAKAIGKEAAQLSFAHACRIAQNITWTMQQSEILQRIAVAQVEVALGAQAVRTAELILTERDRHLPRIALVLAEAGDRTNLKQLLLPCSHYQYSAYRMCGILALLYPEYSVLIKKQVIS